MARKNELAVIPTVDLLSGLESIKIEGGGTMSNGIENLACPVNEGCANYRCLNANCSNGNCTNDKCTDMLVFCANSECGNIGNCKSCDLNSPNLCAGGSNGYCDTNYC